MFAFPSLSIEYYFFEYAYHAENATYDKYLLIDKFI